MSAVVAVVSEQVIKMRKTFGSNVRFMLMNSFSTSADTLEFLKKYPELANDPNLELVQVRRNAVGGWQAFFPEVSVRGGTRNC